jgi:YHS domain-containing protein
MTAARQQRKSSLLFRVLLGIALGAGIFPGIFPPSGVLAADSQLAINSDIGLAISGFDPVAYFTEGKALFGLPEFELNLDGAVWRFSNEGNRGAFERHPEVYAPRFAGYDPVAIGRNRSVPGHPLIWTVVGQRLYFFYSEETRAAFAGDPGRIIDAAEHKWPNVARDLGQ